MNNSKNIERNIVKYNSDVELYMYITILVNSIAFGVIVSSMIDDKDLDPIERDKSSLYIALLTFFICEFEYSGFNGIIMKLN
jgi:hypothetical protein